MMELRDRAVHLLNVTVPNQFIRNVVVLSGSTVLAQSLTVVASPVISRLYTPDDLGVLTMFMSLVSMAWVFSSGRYEFAITLPADDEDAFHLVMVSMAILVCSAVVLTVALLLWEDGLVDVLNSKPLRPFMLLIPLGIVGYGAYQIGSCWPVRKRTYGLLARTKVWQSVAQVSVQILGGIFAVGSVGLIVGDIFGRSSGSFALFKRIFVEKRDAKIAFSLKKMGSLALRYKRFPLLSTWSSLLLTIASAGVPMIIGKYYGLHILGFYGLAQLILGTPLSLIATSTSKVFVGDASRIRHDHAGGLTPLFWRTLKQLAAVTTPIVLIACAGGSWIVPVAFGERWGDAVIYLQVLSPMFLLSTICTPTFGIMDILERQDLQLFCEILRVPLVIAPLVIGAAAGMDPIHGILMHSVGGTCYYIINTGFVLKAIRSTAH